MNDGEDAKEEGEVLLNKTERPQEEAYKTMEEDSCYGSEGNRIEIRS